MADGSERPRAVLFDLDDTLLDNSGNPFVVAQACAWLAEAHGFDADRVFEASSRAWGRHWPEVEQLCWLGRMEGFAVSLECWRRALRECGCADEAIARQVYDTHRQLGRKAMRLFDDAAGVLPVLAAGGVRLGAVTNGPCDFQREKLEALGLVDLLDTVVISGECGMAKPDPRVFGLALDQLRVEPRHAWHVGDSLLTDVAGAQAAGLFAVWLNRLDAAVLDGDICPDAQIGSLASLASLLEPGPHTG